MPASLLTRRARRACPTRVRRPHLGIAPRPGNSASEWYLVPGWLPCRLAIGGWLG